MRTSHRFPAMFSLCDVRGRSPGSEGLTHRLPELLAQWYLDGLTLPYRRGSSTGFASRNNAHLFPVSPNVKVVDWTSGHREHLRRKAITVHHVLKSIVIRDRRVLASLK